MKAIVEMTVAVRRQELAACRSELLAVGVFSGRQRWEAGVRALDRRLGGALSRGVELGDFKGEVGSASLAYGDGRVGPQRILIVGLGDLQSIELDALRKAAALAAGKAMGLRVRTLTVLLHTGLGRSFEDAAVGRAIAEGACFGGYRYDEYVTAGDPERPTELKVEILEPDRAKARAMERGVEVGEVIGRASRFTRTAANRPGNVIDPAALAALARRVARGSRHLSCTVWGKKELEARGMGGILAVGSGSVQEPCLIAMRYGPRGRTRRPAVGLVGKAITFDSGGISIKPAADMDQMKFDKSGGLAVLGTLKAIDELGLDTEVLGLIPAAENLPSGSSYRPGDIVTTYSGKTVEILNTDAEGRMILCDALAYAVEQGCERIVDIATLTGACVVALGKAMAGVMGNDEAMVEEMRRAARESGEKIWPLPCGEEYADEMKSKIADLKNTGGKWGGACTAAAFLRQFVGGRPWVHLDIAGVDVCPSGGEGGAQGASGFGVRLLTAFLMNRAETKQKP
jgi:leucyl aminopeptidase